MTTSIKKYFQNIVTNLKTLKNVIITYRSTTNVVCSYDPVVLSNVLVRFLHIFSLRSKFGIAEEKQICKNQTKNKRVKT